jgi:uncharacterized protein
LNIYNKLQERRAEIIAIASKHGAYNVRVFGSVARHEADSASDLDLLVDMEPERSLLDLGGMLMDLQDLLGCRVMSLPRKDCEDVSVSASSKRPRRYERRMRNILVHRYFDLDKDLVWKAVMRDLPDLKEKVRAALEEEDEPI